MDQQIRVLVVDDDEPHADAVAESLERVGYECVVATSGAEGLRLIEEQTFDIIITDLIMEGVGGLEILAQGQARAARRRGCDPHRSRHDQDGRHRHAGRGADVSDQAARYRRAADRRGQGVAVAAAGSGRTSSSRSSSTRSSASRASSATRRPCTRSSPGSARSRRPRPRC